jgi:membrane protease subunit HflK
MSELDRRIVLADGAGGGDSGGGDSAPARRAASVQFRAQEAVAGEADLLDPANQSLAAALKITYRLVLAAMGVIGGLYALSGFKTVREGERAIRIVFGARTEGNIEPGFRASFPFPIGNLITVNVSPNTVGIDTAFWPFIPEQQKNTPIEQLTKAPSLDPINDGSLLTADGNIAHTRWTFTFRREDPTAVMTKIKGDGKSTEGFEDEIVSYAVRRGVIQAVATTTIDDLLKQAPGEDGTVASRAKGAAQATLDRIGSGLRIDTLKLEAKMPPLFVQDSFRRVQAAESEAAKKREEAETEARRLLTARAGDAAQPLVNLIAEYERTVALGKPVAEQEAVLARVDALLEGRAVEINGRTVEARAAGDVAQMMSTAGQYRSEVVSRRSAELSRFNAMLEQYRSNPLVTIHTAWLDAYQAFLSRETVELALNPATTGVLDISINRDPNIERERQQAAAMRQAEDTRDRRTRELMRERFQTQTGAPASE